MAYRYLLLYKPYNVLSQFTDGRSTDSRSINSQSVNGQSVNGKSRATLKDFVNVPNVYAVGRLDRDSEGLLLLTDDGPMQHRLSHPKFGHRRQYWVQVEHAPNSPPLEAALEKLRQGISIRDYRTRPAQARAIAPPTLPPRNPPIRYRKQVPTTWLEIILSEGKNRQVRRMTAAVGFPTLRLVRSAVLLPSESARGATAKRRANKPRSQTETPTAEKPLTLAGLQPGQWRDLTPEEVRRLPRR